MIIKRKELDKILEGDRLLLFGRRKTGKTFYTLLKKRDWDYAIVRSRNSVLVDDTTMDMRSFLTYVRKTSRIIIDEFHRADPMLFDALQAHKFPEKTILITSTMHFFRRRDIYSKILGLLPEYKVSLISPVDLVKHLQEQSLENVLFWQEPTQIGHTLEGILRTGKLFVQELVGEILTEEDVGIHKKMRGILLATAGTTTKLTEIAGTLSKIGYIDRAETGLLTPYMDMAIKIGLVERIPLFGKKKGSLYRHVSPLTDLFYYLDKRYYLFERDLPLPFLLKVIRERMSFYVERFLERFFAEFYGLQPVKCLKPEIDVLLLEFKKPKIAAEVKWKSKLTGKEVREIEEKLGVFEEARKILFVKDASGVPETELEVWDVERLRKEVEGVAKSKASD